MTRYAMDFTLAFSVPTDNPDPEALTAEQIASALRERVNDLLAEGDTEVMSAVWPPTVFDYESGGTLAESDFEALLPDGTRCEWDERLRIVGALRVPKE